MNSLVAPIVAAATTTLLPVSAALAQEDPLKGTWLVRGTDERGPYDGTLRFEKIEAGRYRARATLQTKDSSSLDRSYEGTAILDSFSLTIYRPTSTGIIGALANPVVATGVVTASVLNVRAGPSTSTAILGTIKKDGKVEVLAREGDFYRIQRAGPTAYVSAAFVKLDAPVPTEWVGKYKGGGPAYDGTWTRNGIQRGTESLARIRESQELTFASIDLTSDKDAKDFNGRFAFAYGWKNLVDLIPGGKDVAHPTMSLQQAIVSPYGHLRVIDEHNAICELTSTVAMQNIAIAREWLPTAGIRLSADKKRGQLLGGAEVVDGEVSFANFLFVSSHGYPSGRIKYTPSFEPFAWFEGTIMDVADLAKGARWRNGQTRWVMLAMCNVLREEYWDDWAQALRDDTGIRGVLGYFRAAPGPEGTRIINDRFFEASRQGKSILEAWKYANYEVSTREGDLTWCALVREDAVNDSLEGWTRDKKLPAGTPGARVLYFSTLPAEKKGIPVAKTETNIAQASVAWITSGRPVTPTEVTRGGGLVPGQVYDLQVNIGRPLAAGEKVELTFVNVRETYWEQHGELDFKKMFDPVEPSGILSKRGLYPPTFTHEDTIVLDRTKLTLVARNDLLAHIHENEAEIWVKVTVFGTNGEVIARGSSISEPLIARPIGTNPHGP